MKFTKHPVLKANSLEDPLNFGIELKGWGYADEMFEKYEDLI